MIMRILIYVVEVAGPGGDCRLAGQPSGRGPARMAGLSDRNLDRDSCACDFSVRGILRRALCHLALAPPPPRANGLRNARWPGRTPGCRHSPTGLWPSPAGDAEGARKQTRRAGSLLEHAPMTLLLEAQTAQLAGDDAATRTSFEKMLKIPENRISRSARSDHGCPAGE